MEVLLLMALDDFRLEAPKVALFLGIRAVVNPRGLTGRASTIQAVEQI
jgi:hypothetical protein